MANIDDTLAKDDKKLANYDVMITTIDNPYDPFNEFDDWLLFDIDHGYNTCEYLARIATTSNELSDEENKQIVEDAIDEIIYYDFTNMYKKVTQESNE